MASDLEMLKAVQVQFFRYAVQHPEGINYICNRASMADMLRLGYPEDLGTFRDRIGAMLKADGIRLDGEGFGRMRGRHGLVALTGRWAIPNERRRLWLARKIEELS